MGFAFTNRTVSRRTPLAEGIIDMQHAWPWITPIYASMRSGKQIPNFGPGTWTLSWTWTAKREWELELELGPDIEALMSTCHLHKQLNSIVNTNTNANNRFNQLELELELGLELLPTLCGRHVICRPNLNGEFMNGATASASASARSELRARLLVHSSSV